MANPIVSQRKGLEIFRAIRAKLTDRGLIQDVAEIYAKDAVQRYGTLVLKGKRFEAHALVTDEYADMIASMHREAFRSTRERAVRGEA